MHSQSFRTFLFSLTTLLYACNDGGSVNDDDVMQHRLVHLENRALDDLVFIEGGSFTMGDFGAVGEDGVWRPFFPPTIKENTPHEVTLSNYSLSRYKTTWQDFDTYLVVNNLPVTERSYQDHLQRMPFDKNGSSQFFVEKPARATWQEAKNYCEWLGLRTGLPMDLPTSAQWEFAGRNRGSTDWVFSTHDGKPLRLHSDLYERVAEGPEFVPIGSRLPPNPLGIYDMADNGKEWVNDWFSDTWYQENPVITDPKGPAEGAKRTVRNLDFSF